MIKKIILILLLFSNYLVAQQEVFTIKNTFGDYKIDPNQTFVVEDEKNGNFAVFMIADEFSYAFLYDKDFNLLKEIKSTKLSRKFSSFQGYAIENNTYSFLMNTSNNKKYGVVIFNFDTGFYATYEADFKLKKEKLLSSISHLGTCYLLTVSKDKDELVIYSFNDKWNEPHRRTIPFDDEHFKIDREQRSSLRNIFFSTASVQLIDPSNPVAIDEASAKIKIYREDLNITLTSNKYSENTFLLNFNLSEGDLQYAHFKTPDFERSGFVAKSNSFLLDDKLFQVRANTGKLVFNIIDIHTKKEITSFDANKDSPIDFKNGNIIQKNTGGNFQKNIRTTSAFLRKLQVMDLGIAVYKESNTYVFNIGGYKENQNSGAFIIPGGFFAGAIGGLATSFITYKSSKSVSVEGILDENLEHQMGRVKGNWFEIVKAFASGNKTQAETLFKKNNIYYWGNYNYKQDTYTFYGFGNN